ncbi:hypothetical protein [Fibrobacter sp. UWB11]|uniref:hypothetical protein n=1 Tax=Fibrobacter sp. UWB11 TaxID=1896202 RepID=UPI000925939C|nr:hypothetical protein [Fibrobacter sp. UWB11]SIO12254.1 hypothetical protein SAMN05720758_1530 [Fibrobacter sp. UWB11]
MRCFKLFVVMAVFGMAFVGCSGSKQHKDASWTQKPSSLKVVFTTPEILNKEKDSDGSNEWTVFPWYYASTSEIAVPGTTAGSRDTLMISENMKKLSEWFSSNVDNTLKFNSNVHYTVEKISKDNVLYSDELLDGDSLRVSKPASMSDAEVYMILDSIEMKSYQNLSLYNSGLGTPAFPIAVMGYRTNNCVKISASYAFYDAKAGKRMDFGRLEEDQCSKETVIEHDWVNVLRDLVLHAIDKTPIAQF